MDDGEPGNYCCPQGKRSLKLEPRLTSVTFLDDMLHKQREITRACTELVKEILGLFNLNIRLMQCKLTSWHVKIANPK